MVAMGRPDVNDLSQARGCHVGWGEEAAHRTAMAGGIRTAMNGVAPSTEVRGSRRFHPRSDVGEEHARASAWDRYLWPWRRRQRCAGGSKGFGDGGGRNQGGEARLGNLGGGGRGPTKQRRKQRRG